MLHQIATSLIPLESLHIHKSTLLMRGAPKQLVDEYDGQLKIEILPDDGITDPEVLLAEKKRLEKRLVEVNKLLGQDLKMQ